MFVATKVGENQVYPYKQEGNFIPAGTYFRFLGHRPDALFKKTYALKACQRGRDFLWLAPYESWIKYMHDGILLPAPHKLVAMEPVLLSVAIEELRGWQVRMLVEAYNYLRCDLPYRMGWVAPLGAGKTLAGLLLSQFFNPGKTAVLVSKYLHETWKSEAKEWGIPCPILSTYESAHNLPDDIECLVIDEVLAFKNPDALRTQKAVDIAAKCEAVVGFSGIITSGGGPKDLRWLRAVNPGCVPGDPLSWQFKWGLDTKLTDVGSNKVYVTETWDNEAISAFVAPFIHTVGVAEIAKELPEVTYVFIECEAPIEYEQIKGGAATCKGKPKALAQVLQCTDGFVYNDEQKPMRIRSPKMQAVAEWLEKLDEPVVLACNWSEGVNILVEMFTGHFPAVLSGATKDAGAEIHRFKSGQTRLMIVNAGYSKGMNLQKVCRVLGFVSISSEPDDYEQLVGRFVRPGQKYGVTVAHFVCKDTMDRRRIELVTAHRGCSADFIEKLLLEELNK